MDAMMDSHISISREAIEAYKYKSHFEIYSSHRLTFMSIPII